MEEIRLVFMGKKVFCIWWWIKTNSAIRKFGNITIENSEFKDHKRKQFPNVIFLQRYKLFNWRSLRRNEASSYRVIWDWNCRWITIISTIGSFGLSEFWDEDSIEWLSNKKKLNKFQTSDWSFDRIFKPLVTDKFAIEYWDELKLLAHLDSSDNQNAEARIKTILFCEWLILQKVSNVHFSSCWTKLGL